VCTSPVSARMSDNEPRIDSAVTGRPGTRARSREPLATEPEQTGEHEGHRGCEEAGAIKSGTTRRGPGREMLPGGGIGFTDPPADRS
jgi:hypothetical protein